MNTIKLARLLLLAFLIIYKGPSDLLAQSMGVKYLKTIKLTKTAIEKRFRTQYADKVCHKEHYFKMCYSVKRSRCKSTIKKAVERCLATVRIPNLIAADIAIAKGVQIGRCIGAAYTGELGSLKKSIPRCNYYDESYHL